MYIALFFVLYFHPDRRGRKVSRNEDHYSFPVLGMLCNCHDAYLHLYDAFLSAVHATNIWI
jgi:hypothetical protein